MSGTAFPIGHSIAMAGFLRLTVAALDDRLHFFDLSQNRSNSDTVLADQRLELC